MKKVVWIQPGLISELENHRKDDGEHCLLSPIVVNNSLSTFLLWRAGKLEAQGFQPTAYSMDQNAWASGEVAPELHSRFLDSISRELGMDDLSIGNREIGVQRFSVNCVAWRGEHMAPFIEIEGDEEEMISSVIPAHIGMSSLVVGTLFVAYFAFFPQRGIMDKSGILERYRALPTKVVPNFRSGKRDDTGLVVRLEGPERLFQLHSNLCSGETLLP